MEFTIEGMQTHISKNDNVIILSTDSEVSVNQIKDFEKQFDCELLAVRECNSWSHQFKISIIFKRKFV